MLRREGGGEGLNSQKLWYLLHEQPPRQYTETEAQWLEYTRQLLISCFVPQKKKCWSTETISYVHSHEKRYEC